MAKNAMAIARTTTAALRSSISRLAQAFHNAADVDYESQLRSSYNLKRLTPSRGDEEENHRKRPRVASADVLPAAHGRNAGGQNPTATPGTNPTAT